jgi:hypothetical protein
MKKYKVYLTPLLFFASGILYGQSLQNIRASVQDGKAKITYDLTGNGDTNQVYSISIYSSHNNYTSPLTRVTGDIGKNVFAGVDKIIVWNIIEELEAYKGEVTFKVKGEMIIAPLTFKTPMQGSTVRRGKKTKVLWNGGRKDQSIKLELYEKNILVKTLNEEKNKGAYEWQLPKDFKRGNYTMKLSGGSETIQSEEFKVKARIPLVVKVLPVLLIGGAVSFFALGDEGGEKSANDNLPAAPGPK